MTNQQSNSQKESKQGLVNQWSDKPTDASPSTLKVLGIVAGILAALSILFFVIFPGAFIIVAMALFDNPNNFKLPYNGIDFQKIAYIDNQFVMYGIDYDKSGLKQLVIFNSTNGKQWDKSTIKITGENPEAAISPSGTFNYFKGKCYLFGATTQPLVAPDCKHWQTQAVNPLESNNTYYLYSAHSSAIANNSLYVGGEKGVYKTSDGVSWTQEKLPYPQESNPNNFENSFYSMAVGNNKLITETNWWQNKQRRGLIYTKDLSTNQWSYEVYPVPVTNITRGKDRFVAMTESTALVMVDGKTTFDSTHIQHSSYSMIYGLLKFIGISPIKISSNGVAWKTILPTNEQVWGTSTIACNSVSCVAVGDKYQVTNTTNGYDWTVIDFNHKNSKPHWWRRFF